MDHKCNICDEAFGTASELISHKQRIHEYKNYKCVICGRFFQTEEHLIKHKNEGHVIEVENK